MDTPKLSATTKKNLGNRKTFQLNQKTFPLCLCRSPIINSKQQEHSSAAAIASHSNSWIKADFMVRCTTNRAIAASKQQKPIKPALIANAVFILAVWLTDEVDIIGFFGTEKQNVQLNNSRFFVRRNGIRFGTG